MSFFFSLIGYERFGALAEKKKTRQRLGYVL
jgi:hypothetical protein